MTQNNQKYGSTLTEVKECISLLHIIYFVFL